MLSVQNRNEKVFNGRERQQESALWACFADLGGVPHF
jgi:hypothetical protein